VSYAVVIPTCGRPSLEVLLERLLDDGARGAAEVVVVDDRPVGGDPLQLDPQVRVLRTWGRGPAAARNAGWRAARAEWVAFLDDDVVPGLDWERRIREDLRDLPAEVGASQGRIEVPLPAGRRPTDGERGTAGLATARWITADMAYRRSALERVGGFDERFARAYREDADLALRVLGAGYQIATGRRYSTHPVRPAGPLASVRAQRGNADDVLMRRRHGRGWRARIGDGPGRLRWHALTTASALVALGAAATGRRRAAGASVLLWAGLTAEFALRRILPGPRDPAEIGRMLASSVAIPPAACWHRLAGELRWRRVRPARAAADGPGVGLPAAVLFDRDGTLIQDVPYNPDPAAVRPVDGVKQALDRLRDLGVPVGVVSNQSGVARGLLSAAQVARVNARVAELLGPFDVLCVCMHGQDDGCDCRKPAPGLVRTAAAELGVPVDRCVVIGDIGADVAAAAAAGARGILVPNARTRREEVRAASEVAADVPAAVRIALSGSLR
jgi:HAD superfamily hydrolase (TIGR01662 family)